MVKNKPKKIKSTETENKLALLIPVGTGLGGTLEGAESLAYGLLYLIKKQNPDRIVFFTTELSSKTTMKSLKEQYKVEFGKNLNKISQFIKINDIDDFEEFYNKISNQINALKNYRIIVDYTSGTKTMTMAASIAATVNHLDLMFVSGKRGEHNVVEKGSEVLRVQSLNSVYQKEILDDASELFNQYRFKQGIEKLDSWILPEDADDLLKLIKQIFSMLFITYNYWDLFNHEIAEYAFNIHFYEFFNPMREQLKLNYKALKIINDDENELQDFYVLASMINNAKRRGEEGKYDDAIARLYRCMELIAKTILSEYNIDPNNVDIKKIQEKSESAYYNISGKLMRAQKGILRMPGIDSMYMLIYNLNGFNKVGQYYANHREEYLEVLQLRNQSILAHGLNMMDEDDFNNFLKGVINLTNKLDPNFEEYLEATKFPKFKI